LNAEERGFWDRVNERLDAREDPLADPAILEASIAHPERERALVAMLSALDAVRSLPAGAARVPGIPRPSLARRCAAAAAVLGALGLGYLAAWRPGIAPPVRPGSRIVVREFPPGTMPVASWAVSVARREGEATTRDSVGSDGAESSDLRASTHDCGFARVGVHRSTRLP
jgi:hypothetical protein